MARVAGDDGGGTAATGRWCRSSQSLLRANLYFHFQVGIKTGALMGSEDNFIIMVTGKNGHGAMPHLCIDPILAGSHIVSALQSLVSRTAEPVDAVVVSVTQFNAGTAFNITPEKAVCHMTLLGVFIVWAYSLC